MVIPKVLFQTSKYKPKTFPVIGPEWTYIHFTDQDIFDFFDAWPRPEFPQPSEIFRAIRREENKADFFRLYYMFVKGGVFLDSDAQIVGPIDTNCSFFTADSLSCGPVVFNGFMGSEPRHPLVYEALHYIYCKGPSDDYFFSCRNLYTLVHSGKFKDIKVYSELPFQQDRTWITFDGTQPIVCHYPKLGFVPPSEMYMRHWNSKCRLGGYGDGGYVIAEGLGKYDMFISAGVGGNDQFALDFTQKYGMKGFAFDGTIDKYPHETSEMTFIQKNVEPECTEFNQLFETNRDIFLKMDIEGAEYAWFDHTPHLGNIKQMVVEFHDIWNHIDVFDKILQTHRIVHAHANNYGDLDDTKPRVIELTFIRKEYASDVINTTILPIKELDTPNNLGAADLDLNFEPFVSQRYSYMNFISLGGWCGTKMALKNAGLFHKPSLPFDDVRTSIEGIIDCIENDFSNYFPKEIKKDLRFPNWAGFVGDYVGFYHSSHNLFNKEVIESFERKIKRFGNAVNENNCIFLRTVVKNDEIHHYKHLQSAIDKKFPGISYIICFIIPNQNVTQYYKNLDSRTFLFTLNDKTRDDDNESIGDYTPIFNFIKSKNLFVDIPVSNDIILQPVSSRIWLVDGHPMVNKHSEPF